jgi:hypothetical protein
MGRSRTLSDPFVKLTTDVNQNVPLFRTRGSYVKWRIRVMYKKWTGNNQCVIKCGVFTVRFVNSLALPRFNWLFQVVRTLICARIHSYFQAKLNSKSLDITIHMSDPNSKLSNNLSDGSRRLFSDRYFKSRLRRLNDPRDQKLKGRYQQPFTNMVCGELNCPISRSQYF